jgi:hypothetical protein
MEKLIVYFPLIQQVPQRKQPTNNSSLPWVRPYGDDTQDAQTHRNTTNNSSIFVSISIAVEMCLKCRCVAPNGRYT